MYKHATHNRIIQLFSISRPRFWSYLAGPYLLGSIIGTNNIYELSSVFFIIHIIFFIFPANLFLYGINDYFDIDTDKYNPKKKNKEQHQTFSSRTFLKPYLTICTVIFILIIFLQKNIIDKLLLIFFLILSTFYSAPPIRLKAVPFFDFLSNILYIIPGIIAYHQYSNRLPTAETSLSIFCWTWGMHLFSAIPDIKADKKAGITTSAVFLGKNISLIVCFILWSVFSIYIINNIHTSLSFLLIIYPLIPIFLLLKSNFLIVRAYWLFPYINTFFGFIGFIIVLLSKL